MVINQEKRLGMRIYGFSVRAKKFLQLRRDRGAGRLNKHTMRKLYARYDEYTVYKNGF